MSDIIVKSSILSAETNMLPFKKLQETGLNTHMCIPLHQSFLWSGSHKQKPLNFSRALIKAMTKYIKLYSGEDLLMW